MNGFDGEPAFRLGWETERDDIREAVAWNLRHSRRLRMLRVGYGLAIVLLGLGSWLRAARGDLWTASVAAVVALRLPWSEFTGMDETLRLLLLTSGANRPVFVFPKRGLGDPAAVPRLREFLAARVGLRADRFGTDR